MQANKKLVLGWCLLVATTIVSTTSASEVSAERLESFAAGGEPVAFTQTKHIQGLPRPMVSQGYVELTQDRLEWVTEAPIVNRLVVTQQGVYETENEAEQHISGSETVGQLLLALLNQDYEYLQRFFSVTPLNTKCLQLTPEREPLRSLYRTIEACGAERLESVELVETQGNRTSIQLHVEQE